MHKYTGAGCQEVFFSWQSQAINRAFPEQRRRTLSTVIKVPI